MARYIALLQQLKQAEEVERRVRAEVDATHTPGVEYTPEEFAKIRAAGRVVGELKGKLGLW